MDVSLTEVMVPKHGTMGSDLVEHRHHLLALCECTHWNHVKDINNIILDNDNSY